MTMPNDPLPPRQITPATAYAPIALVHKRVHRVSEDGCSVLSNGIGQADGLQ